MKLRNAILAFACLISAAASAVAETPKSVSVPAGNLIDGLESLAKQYGVEIIYPSSQVKGRKTHGVSGTLESTDAFNKLLEGTSLVLRKAGGALLITRTESASGPSIAPDAAERIDEVEIEAWRETLSAMRADIYRIEDLFIQSTMSSTPIISTTFSAECRCLQAVT